LLSCGFSGPRRPARQFRKSETGRKSVFVENEVNPWLRRLARASAWALLAGVVVLVVSGWGITQTEIIYNATFGLIDRRLANAIHRSVNAPLAFFFLAHVLINIKIAVSRRRHPTPWVVNSILAIIGAGLMAGVVYMEYFR
jgi:cytochrome b subunit of formate dehydrogenase